MNRKMNIQWKRPKKFDYNMVVIGAGSAGLVTSYLCAALKAKVALIEKDKMGGDCLNTGCVPSKALIKSAKMAKAVKNASDYGIAVNNIEIDFAKVMQRVQSVIKKIEPHDSAHRYSSLGVDCLSGAAEIISPWEVKVGDKVITTKNITIATGASPFVPPIVGLDKIDFLTSNNLWQLRELPQEFLVLGAGPIGLEMAQAFSRLGSKVTIVERGARIMPHEDEDVASEVAKRLQKEGIKILTEHKAVEFKCNEDKNSVLCEVEGAHCEIGFDKVLVAVGRKANVQGQGFEKLGLKLRANGTLETNHYMQTNYKNIYACGDVTGPYQLTHMASHQAWYCAVNALFGKFKKFKVDYSVVPWCTYTDPEVATVGKNEMACRLDGTPYEVTKYSIDDLDRAITDNTDYGFVKVLTAKGSDKILGATVVAVNAGELITEYVSSMKHNKGLESILATIHSYPTMAEANKYVAGVWKKNHKPEGLLKLVEKFHSLGRVK